MAKKNADAEVVTVSENRTYTNNATGERVVVFHVDMGRVVRFSPEGRGVEERMPVGEFLDQYTIVEENTTQEEGNPEA